MVEFDEIQSWFAWLQVNYPTQNPPMLIVAPPEYDSIGDYDGNPTAFAVFVPDMNRIVMVSKIEAADSDEEERMVLFTTLAHEYRHHLQWMDGETFAEQSDFARWSEDEHIEERPEYEKDAESFVDEAYSRWSNDIGLTLRNEEWSNERV